MKTLRIILLALLGVIVGKAFGQVSVPYPSFSLLSTPQITTYVQSDGRTFVTGTFNIQIMSVGSDGPDGFADDFTFGLSSWQFSVRKNGVTIPTLNAVSYKSFTIPSAGVIANLGQFESSFTLQGNNSVSLPISFSFFESLLSPGLNGTGAYSIQLDGFSFIDGSGTQRSNGVMISSVGDWITQSVQVTPVGIFDGGGSAIPEPSTYAAIVGVLILGIVIWRRKAQTSSVSNFASS